MPTKIKLLFVDDDRFMRQSFVELILHYEYQIMTANDGRDALEKLENYPADIVITDIVMPSMDGLSLLREIQARHPNIFVVVVTHSSRIEEAVKCMRAGAYDYILKPFVFNSIISVIEGIISVGRLPENGRSRRNRRLGGSDFFGIVGKDQAMKAIYRQIDSLANTNANVLITGEAGTGKEITARAIHENSLRKSRPFVRVNCTAMTERIANRRLFGQETGAAPGPAAVEAGYVEAAEGGVLFLDAMGALPLTSQASLLQCIETRMFRRVGGTRSVKSNVRMFGATSRDLAKQAKEARFREDLLLRINVVSIHLPPLRDRLLDIPLLIDHFLEKFNARARRRISGIRDDALEILQQYPWPGNVRELANVIENAAIFCRGRQIVPADLKEIQRESSGKRIHLTLSSWSLDHAEEALIRGALYETRGNLKQAAKTLGIARGTLYSKMKRYGIERSR